MKWLFGALLLANIAYFLWQFSGAPRAQQVATHAPRAEINPERLKRLNEAGVALQPRTRAAPSVADAPAPTPEPPAQMQCYTVGPFASVDAQTLAGIRLQELGLSYLERAQARTEPVYRLFEGPFADVATAERRRRQLRRRGITDHTLTSEGEGRYVIALGLFVQGENAQAAQRDLAARGARPKLAQGKRAATAYWLDTHALAPAQAEALKQAWGGMRAIEVSEKTCAGGPGESDAAASHMPSPPSALAVPAPPTPQDSATPSSR